VILPLYFGSVNSLSGMEIQIIWPAGDPAGIALGAVKEPLNRIEELEARIAELEHNNE
jgi:hypothetical protein